MFRIGSIRNMRTASENLRVTICKSAADMSQNRKAPTPRPIGNLNQSTSIDSRARSEHAKVPPPISAAPFNRTGGLAGGSAKSAAKYCTAIYLLRTCALQHNLAV